MSYFSFNRFTVKVCFAILFIGLILPSLVVSSKHHNSSSSSSVYSVLDYGAVGDGSTSDTDAFMKAWEAACKSSSHSHPTMIIPSNMRFLIQPVVFKGPCKSQNIIVQISGEITAPEKPSAWKIKSESHNSWILFRDLEGLILFGGGTIHGQGDKWWKIKGNDKPAAMQIIDSKNIHLTDLKFIDNPRMHLILNNLETVDVSGVTIIAPRDSPNTDGIHVTGSTNVTIENCNIGTGDDCISIVDGSSDVRASNISCGPGHGISIGSLGKHGANDKVERIRIRDVVFTDTQNGARIKTWQGGRGYARNILFERIVSNGAKNPIIIDQFYCDQEKCKVQDSAVQVQDVTFRNVTGTSKSKIAVRLDCSETITCQNIIVENIQILSENGKEKTSSHCTNVNGTIHGLQIPELPCLTQM